MPWCFRENARDLAEKGKAFVINLDDSGGEGTHWTAARLIGDNLFYADPFGTILGGYPPKELRGYNLISNGISWQRPSTSLCGYYAYLFAKAMNTLRGNENQKDLEHKLWTTIE